MSTDNNNANGPAQEPDDELSATLDNGDSPEADAGDAPRMMQVPAEFVERLPPDVLATLPQEVQANLHRSGGDLITHTSVTSMSMMLGSMVNPIASRVTEQHITDIIGITSREADYTDRQSEREYADRKHSRNVGAILIGSVIVALTAIIMVLIFQGVLDFLREMAMLIIPALGGIGFGIIIGLRIGIRYANSRSRQ